MNQEFVDKIADLERQRQALEDYARISQEQAEAMGMSRVRLMKECDHTWPDGRSAWRGMFMYSECEICGYNDL